MTANTYDYRFRHCQAKLKADAARVKSEYGQRELTAPERQIYEHLGYLDPRLADGLVKYEFYRDRGKMKLRERQADEYKRKGG